MRPTDNPEKIKAEKQDGIIRILISLPNEGHTQVEAYANRMTNMLYLGKLEGLQEHNNSQIKFQFFVCTLGRMLVSVAREEAARLAIESDLDYVFYIDDDMICPDNLFDLLWRHDVDIVAPLAFTRNYPHHPVLYQLEKGYDKATNSSYYINHFVDKYPRNKLVQCDAVGFGAALIKTDVFRKIPAPWFISSTATGEDIAFCTKALKCGFKIYMDTSTKLGHLSHPSEITEGYVDALNIKRAEPTYSPEGYEVSDPKPVPDLIRGD